MNEVALVASDQQKFQKSIKGIKKLLKSGKIKPRTDQDAKRWKKFAHGKPEKKPKKERGLVYISHIPHGFYENEMTQYFRQFGVVTNVRVLRSSRTGRSKGAAFVEFLEPTVADIVADTMNNYLMGKRLLKAVLIPPEKQKATALRKNWNTFENPSSEYRRKLKKAHNENVSDEDDLKFAKKTIKNILKTKKNLQEMGIDYSFFQPVDVPTELLPLLGSVPNTQTQTSERKDKKQDKTSPALLLTQPRIEKKDGKAIKKEDKSNKKEDKSNKKEEKSNKKEDKSNKKEEKSNKTENISNKINYKLNKKVPAVSKQKDKFETPEFIKITKDKQREIKEESGDSTDAFDSDAFEMTMESDDEDDFGSGDEDDVSEGSDGEGDESSEENTSSPVKSKKNKNVAPFPAKKPSKTALLKQDGGKRKAEVKQPTPLTKKHKKQVNKAVTTLQPSPQRKQKKNRGKK